ATAGTPYPATAAAKVEGGLVGWLGGVREPAALTWIRRPLAFFTEWIVWLATTHWLLPIALVPGLVLVWRRAGRALGLVALALLAHPLGMALLAPYRRPAFPDGRLPAFQEGRHSIPLPPLVVLTIAVALGSRSRSGPAPLVADAPVPAAPAAPRRAWVSPVAGVVWLAIAAGALVPAATRYGWAVQNINAMQVHLGHWVDARLPKTARIALNDIGAIAFFSRREVIDLMGLVTPAIIPYRRRGETGVMEFVSEACPEYVIIFPAWFPRLASNTEMLQP